jgi:hypothetical protein
MVVPANSSIATPISFLQNEISDLTNPEEFDGFRYSRMNEESAGPTKNQMVNTGLTYLLFGHGKHAWYVQFYQFRVKILTYPSPGRFLAVTELKLIVATLLMRYDMKIVPGTKPKNFLFGTAKVPDTSFSILVKAREQATPN